MSLPYRWLLDEEAYAFLRSRARGRRAVLERSIQRLAAEPFSEPSLVSTSDEGEVIFHSFVAGHVIVYHVDHAVRRVLILDIHKGP